MAQSSLTKCPSSGGYFKARWDDGVSFLFCKCLRLALNKATASLQEVPHLAPLVDNDVLFFLILHMLSTFSLLCSLIFMGEYQSTHCKVLFLEFNLLIIQLTLERYTFKYSKSLIKFTYI